MSVDVNAIELDQQVVARPFVVGDAVRGAAEKHGRAYSDLVREVVSVMFGPGRVQPVEYFKMRLFDAKVADRASLRTIAGRRIEYANNRLANDIIWWRELTEDKLAYHALMVGLGFPVPELLAVYHPTRAMGPAVPVLRDGAQIAGFLEDTASFPVFCKPNTLAWSLGATSLASTEGGTVTDPFGRTAKASELGAKIAAMGADGGFLFQRTLKNHPVLEAVCGPAIATTRMLVIRHPQGLRVLRTHIKLPTGKNVADNTWRAGNMAAVVDPATGALGRAWVGAGLDAVEHTTHPDTGASLQITLPHWDEAKAVVLEASRALEGLRIIGWDVAITPSGPVLVEANSDPDWSVSQRITGVGLLQGEMAELLEHCRQNKRPPHRPI